MQEEDERGTDGRTPYNSLSLASDDNSTFLSPRRPSQARLPTDSNCLDPSNWNAKVTDLEGTRPLNVHFAMYPSSIIMYT